MRLVNEQVKLKEDYELVIRHLSPLARDNKKEAEERARKLRMLLLIEPDKVTREELGKYEYNRGGVFTCYCSECGCEVSEAVEMGDYMDDNDVNISLTYSFPCILKAGKLTNGEI